MAPATHDIKQKMWGFYFQVTEYFIIIVHTSTYKHNKLDTELVYLAQCLQHPRCVPHTQTEFIQKYFLQLVVLPLEVKKITSKRSLKELRKITRTILGSNQTYRGSKRKKENFIEGKDQTGLPNPKQLCKLERNCDNVAPSKIILASVPGWYKRFYNDVS